MILNQVKSHSTARSIPRFIHLGHDNAFLASFSHYIEEVAPESSDYIIVTSSSGINHPLSGRVKRLATTEQDARESLLSSLQDYEVLIVHSMSRSWAQLLPEVHQKLKTVWSGFGADYYGTSRSPDDGVLGPRTAKLRRGLERSLSLSDRFDKVWFQHTDQMTFRRAAKATDYFSAPVSTDLPVFKKRFPDFSGEFVQLNYTTAEEAQPHSTSPSGDNVLVGNSVSYANNHLETFEILKNAGVEGRNIIVPLSYGEPVGYRDAVVSEGSKQFGSSFIPLLERLPINEYTEILSSCSHVIMGHQRQQALGNVITALMSGASLVLDARNPIHSYLREQGAHTATLADLSEKGLDALTLLNNERENNRKVAEGVWGRDAVLNNIRALINRVAN